MRLSRLTIYFSFLFVLFSFNTLYANDGMNIEDLKTGAETTGKNIALLFGIGLTIATLIAWVVQIVRYYNDSDFSHIKHAIIGTLIVWLAFQAAKFVYQTTQTGATQIFGN